jgi:hypothetical protein
VASGCSIQTQTKVNKKMSNQISRMKNILRNSQIACALLAATAPALGKVVGSDVVNSDGSVTYSYVVDNSKGMFDVAAWSLEFGFPTPDWDQLDTFSGGSVNVPNAGWFGDAGIPVVGKSDQDFISLDSEDDVAEGDKLYGFSFTSEFAPGNVQYFEFSEDGYSTTGTTIGPVSSVPEQGGFLEGIAFVALAAFAFRTRLAQPQGFLLNHN